MYVRPCSSTVEVYFQHTYVRYTQLAQGSQAVTGVQPVQTSERLRDCVRQPSLLLPLLYNTMKLFKVPHLLTWKSQNNLGVLVQNLVEARSKIKR